MSTEADAIEVGISHTRREHAESTQRRPRPLGPASRLPEDLVPAILASPEGYDARVAYALAVIAGWSYSDAKTLVAKLRYYGLPDITVDAIAVTNPAMLIVASAFVVRSRCGRLVVLSFRGTEPTNVINWLTDTDVMQRPLGEGRVHQGFYANLQAVWEEISEKLEDVKPGTQLYITGHSLGAAMAVLAAAKLTADGNPTLQKALRGVYTFGQPAVGDEAFADGCTFADRLYRHVYAYDVVPCLPPSWDGRFLHFGREYVTTSGGAPWAEPKRPGQLARYIVSAVTSCATSFVTRRLPWLEGLPFPYSLDDHSPTRYIEASRAALEKTQTATTEAPGPDLRLAASR